MEDKEKLVELMKTWGNENNDSFPFESVAEFLLKNGVIVPQLNVGDMITHGIGPNAPEGRIGLVVPYYMVDEGTGPMNVWGFNESSLGRTVFALKKKS